MIELIGIFFEALFAFIKPIYELSPIGFIIVVGVMIIFICVMIFGGHADSYPERRMNEINRNLKDINKKL